MAKHAQDFEALVREHQAPLRGFLLRLARNHALADDLAQETFVTMHASLDTFEGRGSFRGWLFRIAYNEFLQHVRAEARRGEVMHQYALEFTPEESRFEGITPEQIELEQLIARLHPAEAAAITLCHSEGFSHSEAAAILQMPLGTVKSNVRRGLEKLRALLQETEAQVHE